MFTITELALFWKTRKYVLISFLILGTLFFFVWKYISWYYGREFLKANGPRSLHMYQQQPVSIARNIFIPQSKFRKPLVPHGFSISFLLKINDWYANYGHWKHVLHRGDTPDKLQSTVFTSQRPGCPPMKEIKNTNMPEWTLIENQYPGVWLADRQNTLRICMTTEKKVLQCNDVSSKNQPNNQNEIEFVDIENVPVGVYFHIAIVSTGNNSILIFINGQLKKTLALVGSPVENENHVFIGAGRSFPGSMMSLRYIPEIISSGETKALFSHDSSFVKKSF